jgi:MazG family protein
VSIREQEQAKIDEAAAASFGELVGLMRRLRAADGCPWDRKQTFDSIKPYTLEETYEVLDAIDARDWPNLAEELGDYVLQAVFYAEMARNEGLFTIVDSLRAINQKLVRRHPHVFASGTAETAEDVKQRWDEIKAEEQTINGKTKPSGVLSAVPRSLPALVEAEKISSKAADTGFDWPDDSGVLAKVREETEELAVARERLTPQEVEHELGDLLFTVVNLARRWQVDPEQALRKANSRFRRRFSHVEAGLEEGPLTLEQMEERWQEAKRLERSDR